MTAWRLMLSSFAAESSSLNMAAVKSTFTRCTGGIIFPELVKKRETSLPPSASRAMDSAGTDFGFLRVLFIKPLFLARGTPERDEVVVFALGIATDFKIQGVHSVTYPANRAVLFRNIRTRIQVIRMREDFLGLLEPNPALWICPELLAFARVENGSA